VHAMGPGGARAFGSIRERIPGSSGPSVVIIEVVAFHVNASPLLLHWTTWYHWARKTHWDALVVQVWSAVLIVAGALILTLELKPRRVTRLPLQSTHDATYVAVTRAGLAGTLRAAATGVDGISSAAVIVRRGRARVIATAAARGRPAADALRQPVTQALNGRLDNLDLRHRPRLTVTASQSADLHVLHQRIETEAIAHARHALGQADLPIQLHLGVSRRSA
jgi:hypothetical protein